MSEQLQPQLSNLKFGHDAGKSLSLNALINIGLFISIVGFGGFVLWATMANLAKGVSAQGIVVVEGKRKTIQHLEGGIISKIYIKDGDKVKQGEVLIELDKTQIRSRIEFLNIKLNTAFATLNRLNAEQEHANSLTFSDELLAQKADINIREIMKVQQSLFVAHKDLLEGRASILQQKIQQLDEKKLGLESQKTAAMLQLDFLNDELDRSKILVRKKIVSLSDIISKKRDKANVEGEVGRLKAEISGASVTQAEAKLEILQLQKQFDQEVAQNILENREKIFELQSQLIGTTDVFRRLNILAPQDGTIISLNIFTIGGVIPAGSPILEIVPTEDNLVIETKIGAIDIDNIFLQQKVRVRLSAFKMRSTPLVQGLVENISPDIIVNQQTGESYYLIQISIAEEELAKIREPVLPGMPAEILIETGSRTPLEYMLEPLEKVVERALNED
ncbi:MAG: HlyD family type I secretion periplasmic adaptor subunit [Rhizobiales bacterium]|nr:HlyD family type I secretion periplasmic adaptor subunit [Hyphomicrobiales bacterium]